MSYKAYLSKHKIGISVFTLLFVLLGLTDGSDAAIGGLISGLFISIVFVSTCYLIKRLFGKLDTPAKKQSTVKSQNEFKTKWEKWQQARRQARAIRLKAREEEKRKRELRREEARRKEAEAKSKAEEEHMQKVQQWQNMDLSTVARKSSEIHLAKTEYVYFKTYYHISWNEQRTRSRRINYGGLTGSIHIAKGLNYRLGSIRAETQKETYLKEVFVGHLLLTDRRIVLLNSDSAKAYRFTRILRVIPYSDGAVIVSESGKQTILTGFQGNDGEEFNILLDRLMNE